MDKKIRILLVCVGLASLATVGIAVWTYFSAQNEVGKYARKQGELEKQTKYLQEKLNTSQEETNSWRRKSESVSATLDKLGKEYTLLKTEYDSLLQEKNSLVEQRDSLAEQNQQLDEQLEQLNQLYAQALEEAKSAAPDASLSALLEEKADLEAEVTELKRKISLQEEQIATMAMAGEAGAAGGETLPWQNLQKEVTMLEGKLEQARNASQGLEGELARAKTQLQAAVEERDRLAGQLAKIQETLAQRLTELNQALSQTKEQTQTAAEEISQPQIPKPAAIQLSPIIVKAGPVLSETLTKASVVPAAPTLHKAEISEEEEQGEPQGLAGRIITVNDQYKFVVIDIGRDDGVEDKMRFAVYRQGKKVGNIEVIETRKNIAACDIKETEVRHLQVSDEVQQY